MTVDPSKALSSCLEFLGLPPHDIARAVAGIEEVIEDLIEERDGNETAFKVWRRRCMEVEARLADTQLAVAEKNRMYIRESVRADKAETDRDLAIAHDRQPYPTAWAYERACEALEKHRLRADSLEAAVRHVVDNWDQDADVSILRRALLQPLPSDPTDTIPSAH